MGNSRDEPGPFNRSTVSEETQQLSEDIVYQGLASTRRRRLLYTLREETTCTVGELVMTLVEWEGAQEEPTEDERRKKRIALVHSDLPLLADAELVAYDRKNEVVKVKPLDPLIDAILTRSVDSDTGP